MPTALLFYLFPGALGSLLGGLIAVRLYSLSSTYQSLFNLICIMNPY